MKIEIFNPSTGRKGRVFALVVNGAEPGMVAVFEGDGPAQTRPYSYGINYLEIIIALALADAEFHWADSEVKRRRGRRCERERSFGLSCLLFQTSNPVRRLDGAGWDADER